MIKLKTLDEYKIWFKQAKQVPNCITNCFFLSTTVKKLIENEQLYCMEVSNGQLLLEKSDGFFRCYYYLSAQLPAQKLQLKLPVVVEFVYGSNELTDEHLIHIEILEKMGFSLGRESIRRSMSADQVVQHEMPPEIKTADWQDITACKEIFARHFNPLYAYFPDENQWKQAIEDKSVFCFYDNEILRGAIFTMQEKNVAALRLMCVDSKCRGQGVASKLLAASHFAWKDKVKQYVLWVDAANSANAFYTKHGYAFDQRKSREYIIMGEDN